MKIIKLFTVLILLNTILVSDGIPQVHETDSSQVGLKKNIIYGTVGYAGLYGVANANYERLIIQKNTGFFKNYLIRVSGGKWVVWGGGGLLGVTGITGLTGLRSSHLEIHLGLTALYDKESYEIGVSNSYYTGQGYSSEPTKLDYTRILLSAVIGYRYQKPGGHFVFRAGAAFPESFYLGLGFCF